TTLPLSFWDYALESAVRILNMVPTKKVDKISYEIWHGKVPNLSYLKVEDDEGGDIGEPANYKTVMLNPDKSWYKRQLIRVVLIKERLKAAKDHKKSYADNRRKPLEFEVGDQVLLKMSPWKGVVRFGKKGKLAPRTKFPKGGDTVTTVT
nr:putative reverse transcriptase domain-containing protein [Tanacetum cinerariifolium]